VTERERSKTTEGRPLPVFRLPLFVAILLSAGIASATEMPWRDEPFSWGVRAGAQAVAHANLSDEDGKEPLAFAIRRVSVWLQGTVFSFARVNIQLGATPSSGQWAPNVLDADLTFLFLPELRLSVGRFKKEFTRVYVPSWRTYEFFALPDVYPFITSDLGLGGRGEGVELSGELFEGRLHYVAAVLNGLEEDRTQTRGDRSWRRSDDGLEIIGRLSGQPHPLVALRAGVAYHDDTVLHMTVAPTDAAASPLTTETPMDLLAYAADATFDWQGLHVGAEFIGHAMIEDGAVVAHGGGFYADLLWRFALPLGDLQPGVRYARHYEDFDNPDAYAEALTGVVNWWVSGDRLRVGLEVTYHNRTLAGADSVTGLVQVALVR